MKTYCKLLIWFCLTNFSSGIEKTKLKHLVQVMKCLNWKSVNVHGQEERSLIFKLFSKSSIQMSFSHDYVDNTKENTLIFIENLFEPSFDTTEKYLLVSDKTQEELASSYKSFNRSISFFVFQQRTSSLFRIQTFKNQELAIANKWHWTFKDNVCTLQRNYNMQGAVLKAFSLKWRPNLIFDDNCNTSGILVDVHNQLANMYNYTYVVQERVPGVWGSVVTSNTSFESLSGVFGDIAKGVSDVSGTSWVPMLSRFSFTDISYPILPIDRLLLISKVYEVIDWGLFLRPFTEASRKFITITGFILALTWYCFKSLDDKRDSKRIVVCTASITFLLLSSYYNGALTMFFSHGIRVPFVTLTDGVALYPKWKPIVLVGFEILYMNIMDKNSFEDWFANIKSQGLYVETWGEKMKLISEGGKFGAVDRISLSGILEEDKSLSSNLFIQKLEERVKSGVILLPKNSPNKAMINEGILKLREKGIFHVLEKKHVMPIPKQVLAPDRITLGFQHMGLAFLVYGIVLLVIFAIFICECLCLKC